MGFEVLAMPGQTGTPALTMMTTYSMWMISRGARHLTFLSRSAADKPEAASLVQELAELAEREMPDLQFDIVRGDVSNAQHVKKTVDIAAAQGPIRGVIHAAMVLKVSIANRDLCEVHALTFVL